jgi:outer membrane protein assembly factor BamB
MLMRVGVLILFCAMMARADAPVPMAAFQGGGPLVGTAPALPAPPMRVRWIYKCSEEGRAGVDGSPVILDKTVYVADAKGILHALDLATGEQRWKYDSNDSFGASPLVLGDKVFIGDLSGVFHAVSRNDGKKLWTIDTGSPIHSSANAQGNAILFGNDGADIYCVTPDGKTTWQLKGGDRVNSSPSIGNNLAFVSGCDAKLRGIDIASGQEKFAADLGSLAPGSAVFAGDRVVVGTDQGRVVCFSADGQKQLWEYTEVGDKEMVYATAAIANGIVVIGARDRAVHGIDLQSGQRKWVFKTRGDVDSPAIISSGRVYVCSKDKKLYVLDLATGNKLWEFTANRSIDAGLAIADGALVMADSGGTVFCLDTNLDAPSRYPTLQPTPDHPRSASTTAPAVSSASAPAQSPSFHLSWLLWPVILLGAIILIAVVLWPRHRENM